MEELARWENQERVKLAEAINYLENCFDPEELRERILKEIHDFNACFDLKRENARIKTERGVKNDMLGGHNRIHDCFRRLSISRNAPLGNLRTEFSWGMWNLFVGPSREFRSDDPSLSVDQHHRNEKIKPQRFDSELWDRIYNLFIVIQELKELTVFNLAAVNLLETKAYGVLNQLADYWEHFDPAQKHIYPYFPDDWENTTAIKRRLKLTLNVKLTLQLPYNKPADTIFYLAGSFNNWLGATPSNQGEIAPNQTDQTLWQLDAKQNDSTVLTGKFYLPPVLAKSYFFKVVAKKNAPPTREWLPNERYATNYLHDERIEFNAPGMKRQIIPYKN